ncbi:ATP-binding cassette domain-containing protein [Corynebacterium hansenii]|uniref:ATP-binding cassette domain-containing protein n=1 Tax=Corynebacterium hansenii TaxID=394964 RepID=A0ABV7ZLU3_9CORY|nr:ABC transporter ATP-binding protein [Corynebacterium hansenii]WJY99039.1 Doxorubicin resistance ATP-binding protein DrrA [Corynebacterium hansenii]
MNQPTEGAPPDDVVLDVRDLCKTYGNGPRAKRVLDGVSFRVRRGQTVALLGANGAGKTTLVNIATTLLMPSSGTVLVCGADVVARAREVREHISLTGQFAAVDGELTGRENLIFFARINGFGRAGAAARADELLKRFRLDDAGDQRVSAYSGGMRRRLDIAASMIVETELLFLDEPTTGLDPLSRRELWAMVDELRGRGVAILLTTQYLDEAERLADDVVLLRDGRTVAQGSPSELRRKFGAPRCCLGFDDEASARRAASHTLPESLGRPREDFTVDALEVSFIAHDGTEDLIGATRALGSTGPEIVSAAITPPSLDDVFLGTAFAGGGAGGENRP